MGDADDERIDVGVFIAEVQKRTCIWDIRTEDYKDKNKKDAAWNDICSALIPNFNTQTAAARRSICLKFHQKWRNIRDYYRKYTKKEKSGSGAFKKFKYIYADQLQFLSPLVGIALTSGTSSQDDVAPSSEIQSASEDTVDELPASSDSMPPDYIWVKSRIKPDKSQTQKSDLDRKQPKVFDHPQISASAAEDEDRSFLDSLLPTLRTFDMDQKLEFRAEVLQMLQRIRRSKAIQDSRELSTAHAPIVSEQRVINI